jgi:hypothetical protein
MEDESLDDQFDRLWDEAVRGGPLPDTPEPSDNLGLAVDDPECPACGLPMFWTTNPFGERVQVCIDAECFFA